MRNRSTTTWALGVIIPGLVAATTGFAILNADQVRRNGGGDPLPEFSDTETKAVIDAIYLTIPGLIESERGLRIPAFNWGGRNPRSFNTGRRTAEGRVSLDRVTFTKSVDVVSPQLFQSMASGTSFPGAKIAGYAGDAEVYTLVLEQVFVDEIVLSGSPNALTEEVLLSFGKVTVTYGDRTGRSEGSWDVRTGSR